MKYYVQRQSVAGNWCDTMGTDILESAVGSAEYDRRNYTDRSVRVVSRVDTPVWLNGKSFAKESPAEPRLEGRARPERDPIVVAAKKAALAYLNDQLKFKSQPPLKRLSAVWWDMYGKEWILKEKQKSTAVQPKEK